MSVYPLLLSPTIKNNLWGGTRLISEYGYQTTEPIAAEAWLLSCHKDGASFVVNGPLAGKALPEVLELWGEKVLGQKAAAFPYFPLLLKLIDAKDTLSVQVHPNDEYAMRVEGEFGKTEMWYVVDCEPGAQLIYGFNQTLSKAEFEKRIEENTLPEVCNYVTVHPGDVFFIEAGTLHAIGNGILIAEIQQNSNTTYRVYDYGRLGADGKPRDLHIQKAVDVTETIPPKRPYGAIGETIDVSGGQLRPLASCDLFSCEHRTVTSSMVLCKKDTFQSVLVLSGTATVSCNETETFTVKKGDSLFIPAEAELTLCGKAEFLYSYL